MKVRNVHTTACFLNMIKKRTYIWKCCWQSQQYHLPQIQHNDLELSLSTSTLSLARWQTTCLGMCLWRNTHPAPSLESMKAESTTAIATEAAMMTAIMAYRRPHSFFGSSVNIQRSHSIPRFHHPTAAAKATATAMKTTVIATIQNLYPSSPYLGIQKMALLPLPHQSTLFFMSQPLFMLYKLF